MSAEATISSDGAEVSGFALEQIFFGVALFGLALLVFIPAFNGGFQWGDDQTITANAGTAVRLLKQFPPPAPKASPSPLTQ
jgi:hypothetical protein